MTHDYINMANITASISKKNAHPSRKKHNDYEQNTNSDISGCDFGREYIPGNGTGLYPECANNNACYSGG